MASLEAEVRKVKAENASLVKDNKACYNQIRAKDKQLDGAAKEVEHARQTELHNKVSDVPPAPFAFPLSSTPPPTSPTWHRGPAGTSEQRLGFDPAAVPKKRM